MAVLMASQLLQLVHGRTDDTVHQRDTLGAIDALSEAGYIGRPEAHTFSSHYKFLRVLEHRIQLSELLAQRQRTQRTFSIVVGSVAVLNQLLAQLAPPAVANARREAADIQAVVDREKGGFKISAADWELYSEKVRQERYAFDGEQLRPYFEFNHVLLDGIFYAATRLYGITFKERPDLKGYSPDMYVFEVFNADGSPLALFLGDFYARASKLKNLRLRGIQMHIGSQLTQVKPFELAVKKVLVVKLSGVLMMYHVIPKHPMMKVHVLNSKHMNVPCVNIC